MLTRLTAPKRIVTITELTEDLRISHEEDDQILRRCIERAESYIDGYQGILGRALLSQQWAKTFTKFTTAPMRLDLGPLVQVDSIDYFDTEDAAQTVAGTVYRAHDALTGPYVKLRTGQSWPSTYVRDDAVTITFTAGVADAANVPMAIKGAISMLASYFYENTEAADVQIHHPAVFGALELLAPFRKVI